MKFRQLMFDGDIGFQRNQFERNTGILGIIKNGLPAFFLFDFPGVRQQVFNRTVFVNQLGGGFGADTRNTGNVVDAVTGKSLNINHFIRIDAEFFPASGVKNLSFIGS